MQYQRRLKFAGYASVALGWLGATPNELKELAHGPDPALLYRLTVLGLVGYALLVMSEPLTGRNAKGWTARLASSLQQWAVGFELGFVVFMIVLGVFIEPFWHGRNIEGFIMFFMFVSFFVVALHGSATVALDQARKPPPFQGP